MTWGQEVCNVNQMIYRVVMENIFRPNGSTLILDQIRMTTVKPDFSNLV